MCEAQRLQYGLQEVNKGQRTLYTAFYGANFRFIPLKLSDSVPSHHIVLRIYDAFGLVSTTSVHRF